MEFLTTKQASKIWGISSRRIAVLCEEGRVEGAMKAGTAWIMPIGVEKPADRRIKSGKYRKAGTEYSLKNVESQSKGENIFD